MAELTSSDRSFIEISDQLSDLKRHPAWATYESVVIDEVIHTLKNILFNEKLIDIGQVHGIRAALRALYLVKGKPDEMINAAREIRHDLGIPEPDKEMVNVG